MLVIRMQRTGRKGLASFRMVVQDSKFAPNSGRVVAKLGHYNPHTKETHIDKELSLKYLQEGAQPSPRAIRLFDEQKIALPKWVKRPTNDKKRAIRNPEKLRKNRQPEPVEEAAETVAVAADAEGSENITDGAA